MALVPAVDDAVDLALDEGLRHVREHRLHQLRGQRSQQPAAGVGWGGADWGCLTFHERQPRMGAVMSLGNPPGLMASAAPSSPNPTHTSIISNPGAQARRGWWLGGRGDEQFDRMERQRGLPAPGHISIDRGRQGVRIAHSHCARVTLMVTTRMRGL